MERKFVGTPTAAPAAAPKAAPAAAPKAAAAAAPAAGGIVTFQLLFVVLKSKMAAAV